ncbi:MAG: hypothetical protein ACTHN5_03925 [Phycisphaerae bacterium]
MRVEFPVERVTVRELIRSRVYQEVQDFNLKRGQGRGDVFRGLVQPTDAEVVLNGYRVRKGREVEWKPQFEKACEAFERHGFLLLVDEVQMTSLEEEVELKAETGVTFLKLVPLVGG